MRLLVAGVRKLSGGGRPWCSGAVVLAGRGPVVVAADASGWAVRHVAYDEGTGRGIGLPPARRVPMRTRTLFDLAALTELFTAIAAVQQAERGTLGLDRPVAEYVPAFAAAGKETVTVRQLLTHTSGLPPAPPLHAIRPGGRAERLARLWREPPSASPGTAHR
ncbi:MAG TPA: esterase, partial [Streptomyces sp.]|nr:esterase [Streptomyces sp.]